nr:hypothetical protein [uncultured Bosea sp.]
MSEKTFEEEARVDIHFPRENEKRVGRQPIRTILEIADLLMADIEPRANLLQGKTQLAAQEPKPGSDMAVHVYHFRFHRKFPLQSDE